jgi:VWFA-related protein
MKTSLAGSPPAHRFAGCLVALVFAGATLAQERPLVFQVGAELVVLDLVAVDSSGHDVGDLAASEIHVVEDGSARPVQQLQLVKRRLTVTDGPAATPSREAAVAAAASPPQNPDNAALVIAVDLNSIPVDAVPRVTAAIVELLGADRKDVPTAMIVALSERLEVIQPFTSDQELLRRAMIRIAGASATLTDMGPLYARLDRICGIAGPNDVVNMGVSTGQDIVTEGNRRMLYTANALAGLAQSLKDVPGRKHIVLYSAGYTMNLVSRVIDTVTAIVSACSDADILRVRRSLGQQLGMLMPPDVIGTMRLIVDRATLSQTTFYSVDASGLTTTMVPALQKGSSRGGRVPMPRFAAMSEGAGHDFLDTLARETGGRAFLNSNDLGSGLTEAVRDAESYYLVGYEPLEAKKKGAFREVKISTTRPNVTLRYRRGYYAMSDRERASADVDVAMRAPTAFTRAGFVVSAATVDRTLQIDVRIPSTAIRIRRAGANERATFTVHAELQPASGRAKARTLPGKDVVLDLSPERMNAIRASDKVAVRLDSPAPPPGIYYLTVVARDSSGWVAANTSELVVPK